MRDRYSIVVGLIFLAIVVVAAVNTSRAAARARRSGSTSCRRAGRCPSSRCPPRAGQLEGDANVAQDDCETLGDPLPAEARRDPRLPDRRPPKRSGSATSSTGRW